MLEREISFFGTRKPTVARESSSNLLRKAANDFWDYAVFGLVLWREENATVWENMYDWLTSPLSCSTFMKMLCHIYNDLNVIYHETSHILSCKYIPKDTQKVDTSCHQGILRM